MKPLLLLSSLALTMQSDVPADELPIDAVMERFEEEIAGLKDVMAEVEGEISQLGPVDPEWANSTLSASAAIVDAEGDWKTDVLAEFEIGGHSVTSVGDFPLVPPNSMHRYSVVPHNGPIAHHSYYRVAEVDEDIVFHYFGSVRKTKLGECSRSNGFEIMSSIPWQDWSEETQLIVFGGAQASRDDPKIYCMAYRPLGNGRYGQLSYTPEGRPYILVNTDPRPFVIAARAEATARIFTRKSLSPSSRPE